MSQSVGLAVAGAGVEGSIAAATTPANSEPPATEQTESGTPAAKEDVPNAKQEAGTSMPLASGAPVPVSTSAVSGAAVPGTTPGSAPSTEAAVLAPPAATSKRERSIEELKDRYYAVCRLLIRARPASDEAARAVLLQSYLFEKGRQLPAAWMMRSRLYLEESKADARSGLDSSLQTGRVLAKRISKKSSRS